jgi:hypothetical protein
MVEAMSHVQQLRIVEREWRLNTQKQYCGTAARETLVRDREGVRISAYSDGKHLAYLPVWG